MTRFHPLPLSTRLVWRIITLVAVLTLLWSVLADNAGWEFGVVVVTVATLTGLTFAPPKPHPWSLRGMGLFFFYFLKESLQGGADVAFRALHPRLPLQPVWIDYHLRLPKGSARILFIMTVSLLPGTVSVEWEDDILVVHALTPKAGTEIPHLEERIAALFSLELEAGRFEGQDCG